MKLNSIAPNFYNSNNLASKNNMTVKSRSISAFGAGDSFASSSKTFQNATDTVSFTGLLPFQKIAPAIQKEISELPVSKALQKQLLKLAGGADTFFAKARILLENSASENITANEKACHNLVLGLVDGARGLLKGEGWNNTAALAKLLQGVREALMAIDSLKAEQGIVQTDIDSVVGKKLISFIDYCDDTLQRIEDGSEVPDEFGIDLIGKIVDVAKDMKAADPEGVKQFVEEVSFVKLPFWKK